MHPLPFSARSSRTRRVEHLAVARVELKDRLRNAEDAQSLPGPLSTADSLLAKEILGMEEIAWDKSVCDALDYCFLLAGMVWK
jgi:hypothetical protein